MGGPAPWGVRVAQFPPTPALVPEVLTGFFPMELCSLLCPAQPSSPHQSRGSVLIPAPGATLPCPTVAAWLLAAYFCRLSGVHTSSS